MPGVVRAHCDLAGFVIRPLDDGTRSEVTVLSAAALKGSIPTFIVAKISEGQPMNLARIRKIAEQTGGSEVETRVFADPFAKADVIAADTASTGDEELRPGDSRDSRTDLSGVAGRRMDQLGGAAGSSALLLDPCMFNSSKIRAACIPSANGQNPHPPTPPHPATPRLQCQVAAPCSNLHTHRALHRTGPCKMLWQHCE